MLPILETLSLNFQKILGQHLTGLYLHGSLCLGGFQWDSSDIDLLAVVDTEPDSVTKKALIEMLLAHRDQYPCKGIEFSLMLFKDCQHFSYPTPYSLHLSPLYYEKALRDPDQFVKEMHGTDVDLASHLTIIFHKGICLYGKPISEVFSPIPKEYYLKSIASDLLDAKEKMMIDPVYYLLNFARTDAYLTDDLILSKEDGGLWVISSQRPYASLMKQALEKIHGKDIIFHSSVLQSCLKYYLDRFQAVF